MLKVLSLFPGPLQVICEDSQVQSVHDLKEILGETTHWPVVEYIMMWFQTWQTQGQITACHVNTEECLWACWVV